MENYEKIAAALNLLEDLSKNANDTIGFTYFIRKNKVTRLFAYYNNKKQETIDVELFEDAELFGFLFVERSDNVGNMLCNATRIKKEIENKYSRLLMVNELITELA